jgi:hypothetical protein
LQTKLFKVTIIVGITTIFFLSSTSAYTATGGVELGDEVHVQYVGTFQNGSVFDSSDGATFTISYDGLIEGFVDGVIGMKLDETRTFTVSPDKGYSSGPLAGETLIFEVKLLAVRFYTPPSTAGPEENKMVRNIAIGIAIIGGGVLSIFAISYFSTFFQNTTGHKCLYCGNTYDGQCANCGSTYCRPHFAKKCKNCKSNRFVPK